jgi:hypothetical protein
VDLAGSDSTGNRDGSFFQVARSGSAVAGFARIAAGTMASDDPEAVPLIRGSGESTG